MTRGYLFSIILLICVAIAAAQCLNNCSYQLITKTGSEADEGGNSSYANLVFGYDSPPDIPFTITNLTRYGLLGPDYLNYLGADRVDVFSFCGPCDLKCPVRLEYELGIHEWYVDFFIISANLTINCNYTVRFDVNRWVGPTNPYLGNFCGNCTCPNPNTTVPICRAEPLGQAMADS